MKIMIWGASGYLAGFVIQRLVEEGHDLVLVHRNPPSTVIDGATVAVCEGFLRARDMILENNPDVVLNMANYFSKTAEPGDISRFADVNCGLVTEIAYGCVETGATLFHIGSAWQATFLEHDPSFGNAYALYKGLAARMIEWFQDSYEMSALMLNLYDTYGPRDPRGKIVQFLVNQVGSEEVLEISGGEQILELVHVSDVADAVSAGMKVIAAARAEGLPLVAHEPFWCYPAQAATLRQVVEIIDSAAAAPIRVAWGARPYRVGEKFHREIEGKSLIPGWSQRTSLEEGIAQIVRDIATENE